MSVAPGTRLRCERCGTEAIVITPSSATATDQPEPQPTCCDQPMATIFRPGQSAAAS